jgi:hypothetical protein
MNPIKHTESSMTKFGGTTKKDFAQFLAIHEKLDISKHYYPNAKHRALTHTMFWVNEVMLPLFGSYITLSNKEKVSVKDICEHHILEDYQDKFIPTPQDWLDLLPTMEWMNNGKAPIHPIVPTEKPNTDWKDLLEEIKKINKPKIIPNHDFLLHMI